MKTKTSSIMKGVGIGMLVGGTAAIASSSMFSTKNSYKKMTKKAMKTAEQFLDTIS